MKCLTRSVRLRCVSAPKMRYERSAVCVNGLIRQPGAQLTQVAPDIGVGAGMLGRWRRELETDKAKAFRSESS